MSPTWWDPIMSRVIAVTVCGFMLPACSTTMPSLDFMKSAPQAESLAIESEPPGAEAKTSLGQSCRTPCQLSVQPGSEFSVTLALSGYQPQTVSIRPEAGGATAAAPRLAPNPVHVDLQAVAPPKKPAAKKKKLVAASTSAPALTSAPSTLTEMAPSATNYPWPSR